MLGSKGKFGMVMKSFLCKLGVPSNQPSLLQTLGRFEVNPQCWRAKSKVSDVSPMVVSIFFSILPMQQYYTPYNLYITLYNPYISYQLPTSEAWKVLLCYTLLGDVVGTNCEGGGSRNKGPSIDPKHTVSFYKDSRKGPLIYQSLNPEPDV